MRACMHAFIHSINHSIIQSINQSFNPSIIHSFIRSFVHLFIHSFIRSFIHSFIRSFIHSFIHSSIHLFIHSWYSCNSIQFKAFQVNWIHFSEFPSSSPTILISKLVPIVMSYDWNFYHLPPRRVPGTIWYILWIDVSHDVTRVIQFCWWNAIVFWGPFSHSVIPLRSRHIAPAKISQLLGFGDLVRSSRRGASAARGGTHSCSLMQVANRSRSLPLSHFVMFIFQGFPYSYFATFWYILQLLLQGTRNQLLKNGLSFFAGFMFSSRTPYGGPKGLGARGIYILRTTWWTMSLPPPEQRKEPTPSGFNGSVPYILPCATGKRWKRERPAVWWLSLCNA